MSKFAIEDLLLTAAGDGGSISARPKPPAMESDDLFNAWSIEREQSIECEMLLGLSRATIVRLLRSDNKWSVRGRRTAKELLRQIDDRLKKRSTNPS